MPPGDHPVRHARFGFIGFRQRLPHRTRDGKRVRARGNGVCPGLGKVRPEEIQRAGLEGIRKGTGQRLEDLIPVGKPRQAARQGILQMKDEGAE